jgi:hypothetical protein
MKTALAKGFKAEVIKSTFDSPQEIYPSKSHPGQFRITGNGICIVGEPEGDKFYGITMYADRVITPPREDQMKTPEGRRYAERYAKGLGRG